MLANKRIKTPTILQMDAAECGAVCLAIILGHYGRYLSAEEARAAVDVSRDGSKAINIIKAARNYGLNAEGANLSIEELKEIELPCVVFWEFNHFVVVEGFAKNKIYINNPAVGPQKISYDDFDKAYTGVALLFEPGKSFQKGGKPEPGTLTMLLDKIATTKLAFLFIALVALLIAVPNIIMPILTKVFIDHILIDKQQHWTIGVLSAIFATGVLLSLLTWLQYYYLYRYRMKIKLTHSVNFFSHLIKLPMAYIQQRSLGDLVGRLEILDEVSDFIAADLTINSIGIIVMFLYAIVMFILNWQLALISVFVTIINFYLLWLMQRKMTDLGRRYAQDDGKLYSIEMNGIQIIETIKANALEDHFFNRWAAYYSKKIASLQSLEIYEMILRIIPALLNGGLATVIFLGYGSWLVIQGNLTIGTLIALQLLLISFQAPIKALINLGNKLYQLKGDLVRLRDVTGQEQDQIVGRLKEIELNHNAPVLELRNIEFGYSRLEQPVFLDLSFSLESQKRVAIVGPSGGGKSSLVKLICGLLEPWRGSILLQGVELAAISRQRLANFVGYVDQNVYLFEGTVRENITLWDSEISDEQIHQALKHVCMDEVISERGGLNCIVQEAGRNFSGGQAQRIEIARALIKNPTLLILDEATSAVDTLIEKQIYENIQKRQCALVVVAHRISAIRDCDQIIVVNEGEMIESGTHPTLMKAQGLYYQLAKLEGSL